jgi:hypothetical protein
MNQSIPFELTDQATGRRHTMRGTLKAEHGQLWIQLDGYGERDAAEGCGTPIGLELYEGRLRLLLWPDINSENCQIIDLEGAAESRRQGDESLDATPSPD